MRKTALEKTKELFERGFTTYEPEFRKYQSNKTKILTFERVKGLKERELDFSTGVNFNISK
jgi:hypothetical protein